MSCVKLGLINYDNEAPIQNIVLLMTSRPLITSQQRQYEGSDTGNYCMRMPVLIIQLLEYYKCAIILTASTKEYGRLNGIMPRQHGTSPSQAAWRHENAFTPAVNRNRPFLIVNIARPRGACAHENPTAIS